MFKFTKMHGLGNDYVFIDCTNGKNYISDPSALSIKISNRNFGIGSDGLIIISDSQIADFKMNIFNADGSEAEMCGNGLRCVGKFLYDYKLTNKANLTIETLCGIKEISLKVKNEKVYKVVVCAGDPLFSNDLNLKILDKKFLVSPVCIGNPHAIIFVDDFKSCSIEKYGPLLEKNSVFPNKTNVEFVKFINKNLVKVKVWERGSGLTLACGTGACAVCAVCFNKQITSRSLTVELPCGFLETYYNENGSIYMSGPAVTVYEGIYY